MEEGSACSFEDDWEGGGEGEGWVVFGADEWGQEGDVGGRGGEGLQRPLRLGWCRVCCWCECLGAARCPCQAWSTNRRSTPELRAHIS
jgi:hypothetical protein